MNLSCQITLLFLIAFSTTNAQHDHSSHSHDSETSRSHNAQPPHGGEIKNVGKYYFEIEFDVYSSNEKLNIYILKSNYKSFNTAIINGFNYLFKNKKKFVHGWSI